ncbi:hypothetical protein J4226_03920 [Candidatus Pacearchaeota archaeon]|nr:hypothetical protein [Candidatus Pacearchaeota archaeon]
MIKKTWIILGILILIIVSTAFFYFQKDNSRIEGQVIRLEEIPTKPEEPSLVPEITKTEFTKHNTKEDCWIAYGEKIYNFSNAVMHPNMEKTFFSHCGKLTFQEAAISKHETKSSESRVENFGVYIGEMI